MASTFSGRGVGSTAKIIAYSSLILNVYYFSTWMIIFSKNKTQEMRVNKFMLSIPFGMSLQILNISLILLSIISIVIFAQYRTSLSKVLIALQSIFLLMFVWQSM